MMERSRFLSQSFSKKIDSAISVGIGNKLSSKVSDFERFFLKNLIDLMKIPTLDIKSQTYY